MAIDKYSLEMEGEKDRTKRNPRNEAWLSTNTRVQ